MFPYGQGRRAFVATELRRSLTLPVLPFMQLLRERTNTLLTFTAQTLLGTGGEAQIHALPQDSDLVAKIYHQPDNDYAHKLELMLANPPFSVDDTQTRAAIVWPIELLRRPDYSKQVAGFLMTRLHAMRPLMDYYNPRARRLAAPKFTYQYLHRTARNLAAAVSKLHERGYVIGDVNESNVLVSETALVTLVDTDSFQVRDPRTGAVIRCPVGKPEFTPPELVNARFAEIDRAAEHDRFGLAVLIFQILMEGTHPFSGIYAGAGEPPPLEARISAGHFSYDTTRTAAYRPMTTAPAFEILAPALQQLFKQAFVTGHRQPQYRPTAQAWADALHAAEQSLRTCTTNAQHRYGQHLYTCPWCERARLLNGRDPFPSPEAIERGDHLRKAVRKSTVMALPPSPYYQTPATTHRTYGTASRVVYATSAPPVVPMTSYLNAANAPAPVHWWTRWLLRGQRVMAGLLALAFLFLSLAQFNNSTFTQAPKVPKQYPKSAAEYWGQLLDPQIKIRGLSLDATGKPLALVTNDRFLSLWQLPANKRTQLFNNSADQVISAALSPDGNMAVTGGHNAVLGFWDVTSGALSYTLKAHEKTVSALAFSPDGKTLASGSADSDVKLWNVKTGATLAHFDAHLAWVLALTFSANGQTLASAGRDSKVQLYDWQDGQWRNTRTLLNSRADIVALAFSPDGQTLAAANLAGEILIWDLVAGALRQTITLPNESAYSLAFSPNGQWLASGDSGGMLRVWTSAGQLLFERHGHTEDVRAVAFTADSSQLVTADAALKLWEMPAGDIRQSAEVGVKFWSIPSGEPQQALTVRP